MATNELATTVNMADIEQVLVNGDLSKLTPPQRVQYYQRVCQSIGLNPLTRPFDYITLNNKLTLYAKKDATDQLRSIKKVSIDDVELTEAGDNFIVKVKGHDGTGRSDVEVGIVKKSDMQGSTANAQMKAVTKAKRRLTLSLCGLGWLDETEIESIKDAHPVTVVPETGEIVTRTPVMKVTRPEPAPITGNLDDDFPPLPEEPPSIEVEAEYQAACEVLDSKNTRYGDKSNEQLAWIANNPKTSAEKKRVAAVIMNWRTAHQPA